MLPDCTRSFLIDSNNDESIELSDIFISGIRICDKGLFSINSIVDTQVDIDKFTLMNTNLLNKISQISSIFQFINIRKSSI
jgi:hypothetical protein